MSTYQIVEKFVSINGEGRRAGELAAFIRFKGCNLQCSYCDTSWANESGCESERLTKEEILSWIRETGVKNVTLTGGEPLLRKGMEELIEAILEDPSQRVEIETNGSVDLKPYHILKKRPSFTMDYKTPDSGMEKEMLLSNLELLGSEDTLKFVVSSRRDMEKALEILRAREEESELAGNPGKVQTDRKTGSLLQPCFRQDPAGGDRGFPYGKKAQRCKASDPAS